MAPQVICQTGDKNPLTRLNRTPKLPERAKPLDFLAFMPSAVVNTNGDVATAPAHFAHKHRLVAAS